MDRNCILCSAESSEICFEDSFVRAIPSPSPAAPGHTLIAPRRHVERLTDLTDQEHRALFRSIEGVWQTIKGSASERSLGISDGLDTGLRVRHAHLHLIPHPVGDNAPVGEASDVRTSSQNDWKRVRTYGMFGSRLFVGDPAHSYIEALRDALKDAVVVDMAIAFLSDAGLDLIKDRLHEVGQRAGGRVRIVTGDFLGFNEPATLRRLLALGEHVDCFAAATSAHTRFHPKVCLIRSPHGNGVLFIGSSNLTESALCTGVEWNCRIAEVEHPGLVQEARVEFERLLTNASVSRMSEAWIAAYETRRRPELLVRSIEPLSDTKQRSSIAPNEVQSRALEAVALDRRAGSRAGLVVLATGLGKTFLAAFVRERERFGKTLFVAHRAEILSQSERTFLRLDDRMKTSYISGDESDVSGQLVLASVQKLGRESALRRIAADAFDLVVIDEFHHAPASQYRRILNHFRPRYLLGLTATPDRADEADVLALCGGNLVFRYDLFAAVGSGHLCPFDYFGIADPIEYEQIPWRGRQFELAKLETALQSSLRVQRAIEEWKNRLGSGRRTLVFCTTVQHLRVMRDAFKAAIPALRCASIHSDGDSDPREPSLDLFRKGDLDIIFSVDMLSEGVDVPEVDGILMLRPTDSPVLFLQQLGRGLRARQGKRLRVVDFVGNHRAFLARAEVLSRTTGSKRFLEFLRVTRESGGSCSLPEGCSIEYELKAIEFLEQASRATRTVSSLSDWYDDWRSVHGRAATFAEALREYFKPGTGRYAARIAESWGCVHLSRLHPADRAVAGDALGIETLDALQRAETLDAAGLLVTQYWLEHDCPSSLEVQAISAWLDGKCERDPRLAALLDTPIGQAIRSRTGATTGLDLAFSVGPFRLRIAQGKVGCAAPSITTRDHELVDALSDMLCGWIEFRASESRRALQAQLSAHAISCLRNGGGEIRAKWALCREGDCFRIQVFPRAGGPNPNNDEYSDSLQLLLERLSAISALLVAVYIDTAKIGHLALAERLVRMSESAYPIQLGPRTDGRRLRAALQRAQPRVGQREGARGGNSTRGMYMLVRVQGWDESQLREYLRTGQER